MDKIKISAVSFLNTKPFIFGLEHGPVKHKMHLSLDTPAECARKLIHNEADIGLLPVVAIHEMPYAKIISGYCIGASGTVGSVVLVSEVPVHEIRSILLDYQSKTSVELVKIIAEKYWKIKPAYFQTTPGYENEIKGTTGGLIIGDRALKLKNKFKYVYDLSLCWLELTQLPFVFACWVSNKKTDDAFLVQFENSLAHGISHIDDLLTDQPELTLGYPDVSDYLKNQIQYRFDEKKQAGLDLFISYLKVTT